CARFPFIRYGSSRYFEFW
nr:immunoglobulin heavy chain junction region [Macaca mulatta]MOW24703.1 immunoglobulin heavy chain junction region [Macaca mulatta]MOW24971.1 immunoglobulin heavy chain junction region [Macaca mulatta]MOW25752.1 immunoglobulin heavy chain junction region [Macaca mulatta]MOW26147.1 immunoglobulin heavy chain junction region [Macaca mulatta]